MRFATASELKGNRRAPPVHEKPKEGTKLRAVYDLLMERKGQIIEISLSSVLKGNGRVLGDLRDYYGLDIRKVRNGHWVLAGEWFGRVYVDYIAEHLASQDQPEAA